MIFFKLLKTSVIAILIIAAVYSCCNSEDDKSEKSENHSTLHHHNNEKLNNRLGILHNTSDTIIITVGFNDCGEWGGHIEKIYLMNHNGGIQARLVIDSVPCDSIVVVEDIYAGVDDNKRQIIKDTTKSLTNNDEKIINLFLNRIFDLYLDHYDTRSDEDVIYICLDSGTSVHIVDTYGTLLLHYSNIDSMTNTYYGLMKVLVFGESTIVHYKH